MNQVSAVLLLGVLMFPASLRAEGSKVPKFNPTAVGKGPVLVFKQPENNSDELALYIFDPATHKKPRIIWQDRYHPNPIPLKRLSAHVILIEFQHRLHLVDLTTGVVTPLLAGEERNKLVATEGKTIYFFQRTIPETFKDSGMRLTIGENDKTVVDEYFRARDILFKYEEGSAKKVSPIIIEHLLDVTADGFFVITSDKPQKIAKISRDGKMTEICPFDSQWVAKMTTHAISPKGDYLALAVLGREQDFHEERTLIVCDLKKNKVCFSDSDVPLGPNFFSGRSNYLDLTWRDDKILQYGGPFSFERTKVSEIRFANVTKRVRLNKEAISKLPPISREEAPEREKKGQFELKFGAVYFPGEKTPIASVLDDDGVGVRDLAVDTKGLWAAYSDHRDDQVYVADGTNHTKKAIHAGWVHDLEWLEVETRK